MEQTSVGNMTLQSRVMQNPDSDILLVHDADKASVVGDLTAKQNLKQRARHNSMRNAAPDISPTNIVKKRESQVTSIKTSEDRQEQDTL